VLEGWIIGAAGASSTRTDQYGYLEVEVKPTGRSCRASWRSVATRRPASGEALALTEFCFNTNSNLSSATSDKPADAAPAGPPK
jgi:hypothetical protein